MSGYKTILRIRRLEEEVDKLGFCMGNSKNGNYRQEFGDVVSLFPKEDALPIYSRDAEVFVGTLEEMEVWLQGFQKARQYDNILFRGKHDERRDRKEKDFRNRLLLEKIKQAGETES